MIENSLLFNIPVVVDAGAAHDDGGNDNDDDDDDALVVPSFYLRNQTCQGCCLF